MTQTNYFNMNPWSKLLVALTLLVIAISCNNSPQPEEGKEYIKIEKGVSLPFPDANDSTKFDYTKVKVTFESDGVYMHAHEMMKNVMMCIQYKTPQYKTILHNKEYNNNVGLNFKDKVGESYVYYTTYTQFRKYVPYWMWDDIKAIRFVYHPESYTYRYLNISDYENIDDYFKTKQELGFEYEITIYRDYPEAEILNDSDFESVFELFRAHTQM